MCGRFTVTTKDTKSIADRFQVELEKALQAKGGDKDNPAGMGRFNVAPTQEILVVRDSPDEEKAAAGEREARLMRWGLVPVWAKDLKVGYRMINAKTENLETSKA
jgi:putative SOS response-associated peptidase YedK